ncbi:hypothetical protein [Aestuariivita boseongensis]|uniref:hypothetical protein n=1 Tax=Aestuariivita boseongensis TaxID=1470562 RepID=UPI000680BF0D|nr:hypothetical protein [Aestuariivita boseongensis]
MTTRARAAKPILMLTLTAMVLAGCNTRLNPLNWFGNSREVAVSETEGDVNPLIPNQRRSMFARPDYVYPGVPIQTVTELRIERTRSGAIILVEGIAARQGPYDVQLTPANVDDEPVDGVLSYSFDIVYPEYNTAVGSEAVRRVTVARSISNDTLAQTRVVRVVGASNARETRRR